MVQTRSEETGIQQHPTLEAALAAAKNDLSIYKISFNAEDGTRIRLIKEQLFAWDLGWVLRPLVDEVNELLNRKG